MIQRILYTQASLFVILLSALMAYFIAPKEEEDLPVLAQMEATKINWTRHNQGGKVLSLDAETVTQKLNGDVVVGHIRMYINHPSGEMILHGRQGRSDGDYNRLSVLDTEGMIYIGDQPATVSLKEMTYDLRDQTLTGDSADIRQEGRVLHSDTLRVAANGDVYLQGHVRVLFE